MEYSVGLSTIGRRDLANLDRSVAPRLEGALRALAHDPRPHGCLKLTGERDQYRIRIGQYRIVYAIDDRERRVLVQRIQHRREVYR